MQQPLPSLLSFGKVIQAMIKCSSNVKGYTGRAVSLAIPPLGSYPTDSAQEEMTYTQGDSRQRETGNRLSDH